MKSKESFSEKIIKRFYGISGILDEYKRGEINRIGNNAFMILFFYGLISTFLATLFSNKNPEMALWGLIGSNIFVFIFGISLYIVIATSRLKLTDNEIDSKDIKKERQKLILKSIGFGVYFLVAMHLLTALLNQVFDGEAFLDSFLSGKKLKSSIVGGLFMGIYMYVMLRKRLKKIED